MNSSHLTTNTLNNSSLNVNSTPSAPLTNGYLGSTVHGAPFIWVAPEILALDMPDDEDEDDADYYDSQRRRSRTSETSYLGLDLQSVDPYKADIYSFGIIMWELLDGHRIPYSHVPHLTNDQLRRQIVCGVPPAPPTQNNSRSTTPSLRPTTPVYRTESIIIDPNDDSDSDDDNDDDNDGESDDENNHNIHDSSHPNKRKLSDPTTSGRKVPSSRSSSPSTNKRRLNSTSSANNLQMKRSRTNLAVDSFSTTSGRGNFTTTDSRISLQHGYRPPLRPDLDSLLIQANPQEVQFASIIGKCWRAEPQQRYESFIEIIQELQALAGVGNQSLLEKMSFMLQKYSTHLEDIVEERTLELEEEKKRAESLLYNILPTSVAKRLSSDVNFIGDYHPETTVFFSDIVGFTTMSHGTSPTDVVSMLNQLFTMMDKLADEHKLEKIKTIGDACELWFYSIFIIFIFIFLFFFFVF